MDQKWIQILVILAFSQRLISGYKVETVQTGASHTINCKPPIIGSMITWFRVLDESGVEFIGSLSNSFKEKFPPSNKRLNFTSDGSVTLRSFNKQSDSGIYSCASIKGSELKFGKATRLVGVKDPVTAPAQRDTTTTQPMPATTTRPCNCSKTIKEENPSLYCPPIILGPLAGACGLLLLLLIVTTLYCNKMRTRRCPHHYKKRPQAPAAGKQMMTNRHV